MSLSSFDERIRGLQRLIVGHADDVEIDAAGRILVPPALRRYARLDKHVVLVGQGRKFELWDEAAWQAQTAQGDRVSRRTGCRPSLTASRSRWPMADTFPSSSKKRSPRWSSERTGLTSMERSAAAGHARALLARLGPRRHASLRFDRDPRPQDSARSIDDPRFTFRRAWFSEIDAVLDALDIDEVDGALLDLGISSPQIDDASRGFSFRSDGPLDMRMDPSRGESAAEFLARATVRELTGVLRDYGEERLAQSIAAAIAAARATRARHADAAAGPDRRRSRRHAHAG